MKSIFGESIIIDVLDNIGKGWERVSKRLGNHLDKWMDNPTKRRQQSRIERKAKERQERYKAIAKSQDLDMAYTDFMENAKKERFANMSLVEQEALRDRLDALETENEASQDHDIER